MNMTSLDDSLESYSEHDILSRVIGVQERRLTQMKYDFTRLKIIWTFFYWVISLRDDSNLRNK